MSFDQETRNKLARMVGTCRQALLADITNQLATMFGLRRGEKPDPLERLTHLTEDQKSQAQALRGLLEHFVASAAGDEDTKRLAAHDRAVLEIGFTILNRLAALRLCEERGLVIECVRKGVASDGFRLFEQLSGGALGNRYETYRLFLHLLFDELAIDLGALFDRTTPQSAIFPSERCFEEVIGLLNDPALRSVWTEDETIGWIYQYFNPQEERRAMREASAAPRNSRELAVRNQFFTPRYVVEFLTDNTLGRIWYEMRKGETALKDQCRYLVRRPAEVFLPEGQEAPPVGPADADLSQEQLLKQPVYIPHRPLKDPRTILMLDPACGSMHFGLYAFDLFEVIYDEAWDLEERLGAETLNRQPGMKTLHETYAAKADYLKDVPRLIVEHNIHGIDIDPRAVQIAALALWLRAQRSYQRLKLKPVERPRISKTNIVCAEPMPGEKHLLHEFTAQLQPPVLRQLVEIIFDKMQLAGEAGSLLQIEKEIADAIAAAKKQWQGGGTAEQLMLFGGSRPAYTQGVLFDTSGITDTAFWDEAEGRVIDALRAFAQEATNGRGVQRRLFAEDAVQGLAFLDLCRQWYDVVLMNPPFGEPSQVTRKYVDTHFPRSKNDAYAAFVERGIRLLASRGTVGAITNRTGLFIASFQRWRKEVLLQDCAPSVVADLGERVLDSALVETAAYCVSKGQARSAHTVFARVASEGDDKDLALAQGIRSIYLGSRDRTINLVDCASLERIPGLPFAYWVTPNTRRLFTELPRFEGEGRTARGGAKTLNDFRFLRAIWEVPAVLLGQGRRWVHFPKGGSFSPYHSDIHLVIEWENDGRRLREFYTERSAGEAWGGFARSEEFYFRPGVTWSRRTRRSSFRCLPRGCIFSEQGCAAFVECDDNAQLFGLLAVMNSLAFRSLIRLHTGSNTIAQHFLVGIIGKTPFPASVPNPLAQMAEKAVELQRCRDRFDETSRIFSQPPLVQESTTCKPMTAACARLMEAAEQQRGSLAEIQEQIDDAVWRLYGLTEDDKQGLIAPMLTTGDVHVADAEADEDEDQTGSATRTALVVDLISHFTGVVFGRWNVQLSTDKCEPPFPNVFAPLPVCPPGMLQNAQGLPAQPEDVPADYPIRIPWDGILVDDPNHPLDIEHRVRQVIEVIWRDRAEAIEHEACEILGVQSLRDYFRKPAGFFADHLKRYSKSRRQAPIFWPLSTASGSYTLWIYYHRLTDQTLYAADKHVGDKIADVTREIGQMERDLSSAAGRAASQLRDKLSDAQELLAELGDLRNELLRVAALPWKPNLNDGVIITAAPLHKLFRHRPWARDTKEVWEKLQRGEYDWAHLAYTIWPDRVREKCKTDRSLAIAHGLEDLYQAPPQQARRGRGRRAVAPAEEQAEE